MPDIRFSQTPANASQLCQQDPETLDQFLRCNPQVANGNTTMPEHGIALAERSRGRGIHVADMHEGQKVSKFGLVSDL